MLTRTTLDALAGHVSTDRVPTRLEIAPDVYAELLVVGLHRGAMGAVEVARPDLDVTVTINYAVGRGAWTLYDQHETVMAQQHALLGPCCARHTDPWAGTAPCVPEHWSLMRRHGGYCCPDCPSRVLDEALAAAIRDVPVQVSDTPRYMTNLDAPY